METRFTKAERNQDKSVPVGPDELKVFSHGAKGLGKSVLKKYKKEFDKMKWFVLDNCEEAEPYIK